MAESFRRNMELSLTLVSYYKQCIDIDDRTTKNIVANIRNFNLRLMRQDNTHEDYLDFIDYLKDLKFNIEQVGKSFNQKKCRGEISKRIERLFQQCIDKFPWVIDVYLLYAQYLYNNNKLHKCSQIVSQALKFWPDDERLKELSIALLTEMTLI